MNKITAPQADMGTARRVFQAVYDRYSEHPIEVERVTVGWRVTIHEPGEALVLVFGDDEATSVGFESILDRRIVDGNAEQSKGLPETLLGKPIILNDSLYRGQFSPPDHMDRSWFYKDAGDMIEFNARVRRYSKGYHGHREDGWKPAEQDFKLSHPTKAKKLSKSTQPRLF